MEVWIMRSRTELHLNVKTQINLILTGARTINPLNISDLTEGIFGSNVIQESDTRS